MGPGYLLCWSISPWLPTSRASLALLIPFTLPTPCNGPSLTFSPVSPPGPWLMSHKCKQYPRPSWWHNLSCICSDCRRVIRPGPLCTYRWGFLRVLPRLQIFSLAACHSCDALHPSRCVWEVITESHYTAPSWGMAWVRVMLDRAWKRRATLPSGLSKMASPLGIDFHLEQPLYSPSRGKENRKDWGSQFPRLSA